MPPANEGDLQMAAVRLIKKYPNRRLYDTQTSSYITLADVKQLVLDQEEFKVVDAKSSEDLTRQILSRRRCCRRSSAATATPCRG